MFRGLWKANSILRFQEGLFSARCLIFLYGKLYFEIDNVCYSEDLSTYECNTGVLSLGLISMDPFLRFTV